MIDLAVCEWSPGSNRSLVDPVEAVFRLDMPAPVRGALLAKMHRHQFDDVVRITWGGVVSERGAHQYEAAISNMNFGRDGRLCRTVTRDLWSLEHVENAIVYIVGNRAFGYAAACGNLFEITRREPPAARHVDPGPGVGAGGPVADVPRPDVVPGGVPVPDLPPVGTVDTPPGPVVIVWPPIPGPIIVVPPPPAPVPEPSTWALFLAGVLMVWLAVLRRRS